MKRGISLLLLLAFSPTFLSISNLNTPFATVTFATTYTATNSTVYLSPTNLTTQLLWTSLEFRELASTSLDLSSTGGRYKCVYDNIPFTATSGQRVLGSLTSSIAISYYLLTENDFNTWVSTGHCSVGNDLARQENANRYLLDTIVPADGKYEILLLNFSPDTSATINALIGGSSPVSATLTATLISNVTESTTFTYTQEVVFAGNSQGVNWGLRLGYAFLFLILPVLIIAVLIFTIRRRRLRRKIAPSPLIQPAAVPIFCMECGAELKSDAKFCTKCGTTINRHP